MMVKLVAKIIATLTALVLLVGVITNLAIPFNPFAILGFIVVLTAIIGLRPYLNRLNSQRVKVILIGGFLLLIVVQVAVLALMPASVYHDPFRVYYQAQQLAFGHQNWSHISYFYRYPNNASFAILLSWWLRFTNLFNLNVNWSFHLLAFLCYDGLIASLLYMARRLKQSLIRQLGLFAFFAFLPLSFTYAIQVLYTDTPSLMFLAWIMYFAIRWPKYRGRVKWLVCILLPVAVLLGQLTKPNLIVMIVAVILWTLRSLLRNFNDFKRSVLVPAILIMIGFGLAIPAKSIILQSAHFTPNPTYQLPAASWIYMSLNPQTDGKYNPADVKKLVAMPNKDARSTYLKEAIPTRIKHFTPLELAKHFIIKLGILTYGGNLPQSYTGGHTTSPAFYQARQTFITGIAEVLQRILTAIAYLFALATLLRYVWGHTTTRGESHATGVAVLINLTILGYAAFHTLLWETESRYGLVLLPLIFLVIMLHATPTGLVTAKQHRYFRLTAAVSAIALLSSIFASYHMVTPRWALKNTLIIGQQSQLSRQYHAKPLALKAHRFIQQDVKLNATAHSFEVQVPNNSNLTGYLINHKNNQRLALKSTPAPFNSTILQAKADIVPGHYHIVLINNTAVSQPTWFVHLYNYRLAPFAARSNQIIPQGGSLIYAFRADQAPLNW